MRARHVHEGALRGTHAPDETHARGTRRAFLAALIPGVVLATRALAQPSGALREQFRQRSDTAERTGLAEPFTGITTDGQVIPGLFPIQSTGVSTAPVRQAAEQFLAVLTAEQRARTLFPVDDPEWRKWMNQQPSSEPPLHRCAWKPILPRSHDLEEQQLWWRRGVGHAPLG